MIDNRAPPDGNPHESPDAYFKRYPVPDRHERTTLRSLAELGAAADERIVSDPPGRVSQPSADYDHYLETGEGLERATDPPRREEHDTERPVPITTQPSPPLGEDVEEFIPAPTLRQIFADMVTRMDRLEVKVDAIRSAQAHDADAELDHEQRIARLERRTADFRKAAE